MSRERAPRPLEVEDAGDAIVVRLTGGALAFSGDNAQALATQLDAVAAAACDRTLVLDFRNVGFLSGTALGSLVRLHNRMQTGGGSLSLRNLQDAVYEVFVVSRLTTLFEVRPGATEALPPHPPPRVLVADDEGCLRVLLARVLGRHGFEVVLAATGREAVAHYRQAPGAVAVVLLDVKMPGVDGPQTLAALRQLHPGVRCCFMTGDPGRYTEDGWLGGPRVRGARPKTGGLRPSPLVEFDARRKAMLVLTRKIGEEVVIGDRVVVRVVAVQDGRVRLGVTAPPAVTIRREEVGPHPPEEGPGLPAREGHPPGGSA
jgi:carbon storage regulator CsrA